MPSAPTVLRPGVNCWRVETARRLACLIDNAAYFAAAKSALLRARRSVTLLAWEFDHRTALTRAGSVDRHPDRIGALLTQLAAERPELDVRILAWAANPVIALMQRTMPWPAAVWFRGTPVRFALDRSAPPGACQHQKLLVVDDEIAFVSSDDFMLDRWDRPDHLTHDERRRLPSGKPYPARHGVTMIVDGEAARALAELARERWRAATGEALAPVRAAGADAWPIEVIPDMTEVRVAIARTCPPSEHGVGVRENEALFLDMIDAARGTLYIENQYFASERITEALIARLAEPRPPEIVVICSAHAPSLFDHLTMDPVRDGLAARLRAADRQGRFAIYAPHTAGGAPIIIHSKVTVVDTRLLRVGSTNLNNRSLSYDAECDIAVQAPGANAEIERFRNALVAHFLGCGENDVRRKMHETRSLIAAIEGLDSPAHRRLRPVQPQKSGWLRALVAAYHVGDPHGRYDLWRPWRRRS